MTFSEICDRVVSELNRPDMVDDVPLWVNFAYQEVLSRRDWSFLRATAERATDTTQYRYALPSDFREVKTLIYDDDTSSFELNITTNEEFDKNFPDPDSESAGTPSMSTIVYGVDDTTGAQYAEVWFDRKPLSDSHTLRIRYYINYGDLTSVDTPRFPARYHQILVFGGVELGMARLREYQAAQFWMAKKELLIASMVEDDKRMPRDMALGIFSKKKVYPSEYYNKWWVRSVE